MYIEIKLPKGRIRIQQFTGRVTYKRYGQRLWRKASFTDDIVCHKHRKTKLAKRQHLRAVK